MENLYQKTKKGARTAALAGLALASAGCTNKDAYRIIERDSPDANGYDVQINNYGTHLSNIQVGTMDAHGTFTEYVVGIDNFQNDGRTDEIYVFVRKGSPLEEFASVRKLDEIRRKMISKRISQRGSQ